MAGCFPEGQKISNCGHLLQVLTMVQRTCELCKKDIGPEEAFMKMPDEKAAHEKCFSLGSCPVCAKDLRVVEDLVGANGKKYHVDCFKCSKCQQKLQSYVVRDDNLFCKPCVMAEQEKMAAKSKGTCVACSKDVLSNQKAFSMDEGMYHADCFVCAQCKGDLTQGCTILEDKLCCRSCMNNMKEKLLEEKRKQLKEQQARSSQQKNATQSITCAECNQPITTQALQALGRAWHVGCIKCFQCKNPMSGKLFPIDNEPYCGDCAEKRKQESIQRQTQEQNRKQEEHQQDEAKRRAAHEAAEKEREELTKSLQEKAKIQSQSPGVQCSVCGTHIHGAYQELGGIIHCNDCAEMVQKAIGKFITPKRQPLSLIYILKYSLL